jgi:NAD-dependent dihydropyrimidine dehydrogenase PreA subunit
MKSYLPKISINKCEAKGPCVEACPFSVFEIRETQDDDFKKMNLIGKIKNLAHGKKIAYVIDPEMCRGCMKCIPACPESAISVAETFQI